MRPLPRLVEGALLCLRTLSGRTRTSSLQKWSEKLMEPPLQTAPGWSKFRSK
jgi:hypothetical protein